MMNALTPPKNAGDEDQKRLTPESAAALEADFIRGALSSALQFLKADTLVR